MHELGTGIDTNADRWVRGSSDRCVDLNADLGELPGRQGEHIDAALLDLVSSANVATGGHAGDPDSMRRVCELAAARFVRVGAHLSFQDRVGFGRRIPDRIDANLVRDLRRQLQVLARACEQAETAVAYVKAHGALYNLALDRVDIAQSLIHAVGDTGLPILTIHGTVLWNVAQQAGLPCFAEFFADRGYLPDGRLVPRGQFGDLVHEGVADRVLDAVTTGSVIASSGEVVHVRVDSVCVHGDTPDAIAQAGRIRHRLHQAGVQVRPFTSPPEGDINGVVGDGAPRHGAPRHGAPDATAP